MDIRDESYAHYAEPMMLEVGGGMKRARDETTLDNAEKRQRMEAGPEDHAMLQIAPMRCPEPMSLLTLPSDILSVVAGSLSLTEFANFPRVCKTLSNTEWAPHLGREKIKEMGCAWAGKSILHAIQVDTPMRSDWQSQLYFLF